MINSLLKFVNIYKERAKNLRTVIKNCRTLTTKDDQFCNVRRVIVN